MSKGRRGRRMVVLASAALLCAGVTIAVAASPAVAKKKKHPANPLAGSYNGTTDLGTTIRFTITKSGAVLGFAPTIPLEGFLDPFVAPTVGTPERVFPCPDIPNATVSAPNLRLTKVAPGFPKGKRFDYQGPGASSPAPGTAWIDGKPVFGAKNRFSGVFTGHVGYGTVKPVLFPDGALALVPIIQASGYSCGNSALWQATRVGR